MDSHNRPLVLVDFDGVLNQFPDPKVRRRGNRIDWMRPGDPRRAVYDPARWPVPDHSETVVLDRGRFRITWSSEAVAALDALDADVCWLSTWQPYADILDLHLGVRWEAVHWYDPATGAGRMDGKRRAVRSALASGRPVVWLDDEEADGRAVAWLRSCEPDARLLAIRPDARIGVDRAQLAEAVRFAADPPAGPSIRLSDAGADAAGGHLGL
ncbi:hypothetical protein [Bifidobacterium myosotis]|uniref:Uncharacterized protein n=1 Tax=Bifidobacterium myosotis TaxID=1630166 RepID=A0A5M9ZG64_9BIFI|nr:hypothetical protein [Bifidobacterium myosotis]KAA8825662.1 hypothetical protein EMO91_11910 [Bifidobacterium myosotis]